MPIQRKTVAAGAALLGAGATAVGLGTITLAVPSAAGPAVAASAPNESGARAAPGPLPTIHPVTLLSQTPAAAPSLSRVQQRAASEVSARVKALTRAIARVNGDKNLGADQAPLVQHLQADLTALQQLGQKIAGDTSVQTARVDRSTIYTNYRVFALVVPSVRLDIRADAITNATLPRLSAQSSTLGGRVTPSEQAQVGPLFSDLNAQISAAHAAAAGVPATLAADTPAQWNADHQLLAGPTGSVRSASSEVAKARSDVKQIRADLRAGRGNQGS